MPRRSRFQIAVEQRRARAAAERVQTAKELAAMAVDKMVPDEISQHALTVLAWLTKSKR